MRVQFQVIAFFLPLLFISHTDNCSLLRLPFTHHFHLYLAKRKKLQAGYSLLSFLFRAFSVRVSLHLLSFRPMITYTSVVQHIYSDSGAQKSLRTFVYYSELYYTTDKGVSSFTDPKRKSMKESELKPNVPEREIESFSEKANCFAKKLCVLSPK